MIMIVKTPESQTGSPGAAGVAVSEVRVFLWLEICQGLQLCAEGHPLHVLV